MIDATDVIRFEARLNAASVLVDQVADQWTDRWGPETAQTMASLAPRDTGALAASIRYEGNGEVVVGADYAVFVDRGTSRMAPQPFVTPAITRVKPFAEVDALERAMGLLDS